MANYTAAFSVFRKCVHFSLVNKATVHQGKLGPEIWFWAFIGLQLIGCYLHPQGKSGALV